MVIPMRASTTFPRLIPKAMEPHWAPYYLNSMVFFIFEASKVWISKLKSLYFTNYIPTPKTADNGGSLGPALP